MMAATEREDEAMTLALAFDAAGASDEFRDPDKQPRCGMCGRFAKKVTGPDGTFWQWRLTCVFYDDYMGAWEHD